MKKNELILGDCIEVMKVFEDNCIDSIVTDPPYGIGFMGREWDTFKPDYIEKKRIEQDKRIKIKPRTDGRKVPHDQGAVAAGSYDFSLKGNRKFQEWFTIFSKECLRVLKPGGHLLSFGGTRTYHRMVCGIEDAGFEIRDCLQWLYGSGFPKNLNLGNGMGTALKPANEPIVLARKPISKKNIAENVLKWGTGGINIDECRIDLQGQKKISGGCTGNKSGRVGYFITDKNPNIKEDNSKGRWPANVIFDEEGAELLNSASRFFYVAKTSKSERNAGLEGFEKEEKKVHIRQSNGRQKAREMVSLPTKNFHPTVKPIKLMRYLIRLITPPSGICLDPFIGSGTTAIACVEEGFDYIGIEKEKEYFDIAEKRIFHYKRQLKLF